MKKYVFLAALLLPAVAAAEANGKDWQETCNQWSELAETVMSSRQSGVAMSKMMGLTDGDKTFETMIIEAYDKPRFNGDKFQQRAISDFRDEWYSICVKSIRE